MALENIAICSISRTPFGGVHEHINEIIKYSKYNIIPIIYPPNGIFKRYANFITMFDGRFDPFSFVYSGKIKRFKIVHVHTPPYLMSLVSKLRRKEKLRFVATIHSTPSKEILKEQLKNSSTPWKYWIKYYNLLYKNISNADVIISVSNWVKKQIYDIYPHLDVRTIPNMISVQKIIKNTNNYKNIINNFNLKDKGYVVWLGARINSPSYKRPQDFVNLAKSFPDEIFVIHGKDVTIEGLKAIGIKDIPKNIKIINTFKYKNSKNLYLSILRGAKFGILTSYYEIFGYTVIESLSLNTPVVVPNVGGPPEIVNARLGNIYDFGSFSSLERAVEKMMYDYKRYKNIFNYIYKKYDSSFVVSRIDKIYEEIYNI